MEVQKASNIAQLSASDAFLALTKAQKLYAHHLSRAAWLGARIILQQVSPEAPWIFDFILELYRVCAGDWVALRERIGISKTEAEAFLLYSATFLHNIGNYYGHGDQKFIPSFNEDTLLCLSGVSKTATALYSHFSSSIFSTQPSILGYTSETAQNTYYLGAAVSATEVKAITRAMEDESLHAEHTRITKQTSPNILYEVLYASAEIQAPFSLQVDGLGEVPLVSGDHSEQLSKICREVFLGLQHAENPTQKEYLGKVIDSFKVGSMDAYKDSQKLWIQDQKPTIETVLGFVEPYRDPYGVRAEFEGIVGIVHLEETEMLLRLVQNADKFIQGLPWITDASDLNDRGPFEGGEVGYRDFSSLHTLTYCSSLIFPGVNLPNYNDIRQRYGSKNIMIMNRIDGAPMSGDSQAAYLQGHDAETYLLHRKQAYYLWVVFHELFGHGTGRFLKETEPGVHNFDISNPPVNPITGEPIKSWYKHGETWTGVFGDIATRVDECRAECIGAILLSNEELMSFCGVQDTSQPSLTELVYNAYLQLAVAGLRSLENYTPSEKKWSQAHSQGHFAMFRVLHEQGQGLLTVHHDSLNRTVSVTIDQTKILTKGKPALESLALRLHIYRCTADVDNCRQYFDDVTRVSATHLAWREIVMANKPPPSIFVQPNTFLIDGEVTLKDYPPTVEGVIQSWAERCV